MIRGERNGEGGQRYFSRFESKFSIDGTVIEEKRCFLREQSLFFY